MSATPEARPVAAFSAWKALSDTDRSATVYAADKLKNESGLVADRKYHFSTYRKCMVRVWSRGGRHFCCRDRHGAVVRQVGSDVVRWLLANKLASDVPQAVQLGQRMVSGNLLHHVTDDHDFKNENLFYRFRSDDEGGPAVFTLLRDPTPVRRPGGPKGARARACGPHVPAPLAPKLLTGAPPRMADAAVDAVYEAALRGRGQGATAPPLCLRLRRGQQPRSRL